MKKYNRVDIGFFSEDHTEVLNNYELSQNTFIFFNYNNTNAIRIVSYIDKEEAIESVYTIYTIDGYYDENKNCYYFSAISDTQKKLKCILYDDLTFVYIGVDNSYTMFYSITGKSY